MRTVNGRCADGESSEKYGGVSPNKKYGELIFNHGQGLHRTQGKKYGEIQSTSGAIIWFNIFQEIELHEWKHVHMVPDGEIPHEVRIHSPVRC